MYGMYRCRGQTLRVLDSNPLQVLLYFLVLLDAGVVIAEILIDLHAMRSQFNPLLLCFFAHYTLSRKTVACLIRDGRELDPSKNETNQNPGFANNRTEPEAGCHGSCSVLRLNEIVPTFTHFMVFEAFTLLRLTKFMYQPNDN